MTFLQRRRLELFNPSSFTLPFLFTRACRIEPHHSVSYFRCALIDSVLSLGTLFPCSYSLLILYSPRFERGRYFRSSPNRHVDQKSFESCAGQSLRRVRYILFHPQLLSIATTGINSSLFSVSSPMLCNCSNCDSTVTCSNTVAEPHVRTTLHDKE